jgi:hypothetical protein
MTSVAVLVAGVLLWCWCEAVQLTCLTCRFGSSTEQYFSFLKLLLALNATLMVPGESLIGGGSVSVTAVQRGTLCCGGHSMSRFMLVVAVTSTVAMTVESYFRPAALIGYMFTVGRLNTEDYKTVGLFFLGAYSYKAKVAWTTTSWTLMMIFAGGW